MILSTNFQTAGAVGLVSRVRLIPITLVLCTLASASAETLAHRQMAAWIQAADAEWQLSSAVRVVEADHLRDDLGRSAAMYLEYGCRRMSVAGYRNVTDPLEVTVQLFDVTSDLQAFGLSRRLRPATFRPADLGDETVLGDSVLILRQGKHVAVVRVANPSHDETQRLVPLAESLSRNLPSRQANPERLQRLDLPGLVSDSKAWYPHAPLGYGVLGPTLSARYVDGDDTCTVYIVRQDDGASAVAAMDRLAADLGEPISLVLPEAQVVFGMDESKGPSAVALRGRYVSVFHGLSSQQEVSRERVLVSIAGLPAEGDLEQFRGDIVELNSAAIRQGYRAAAGDSAEKARAVAALVDRFDRIERHRAEGTHRFGEIQIEILRQIAQLGDRSQIPMLIRNAGWSWEAGMGLGRLGSVAVEAATDTFANAASPIRMEALRGLQAVAITAPESMSDAQRARIQQLLRGILLNADAQERHVSFAIRVLPALGNETFIPILETLAKEDDDVARHATRTLAVLRHQDQ